MWTAREMKPWNNAGLQSMNLRTYTLFVSVAAIIGLLLSIVPLLRSFMEYRSPNSVAVPAQLASRDVFFLAKKKDKIDAAAIKEHFHKESNVPRWWLEQNEASWQAMYDDATAQHIKTVRSQAVRNLVAYGALSTLCIGLLMIHLPWSRRLERRATGSEGDV